MLSSLQTYIPGLKALAESLYQCGEFEQSLLYYEKVRTERRNSFRSLIGRIWPSHWLRDFILLRLLGGKDLLRLWVDQVWSWEDNLSWYFAGDFQGLQVWLWACQMSEHSTRLLLEILEFDFKFTINSVMRFQYGSDEELLSTKYVFNCDEMEQLVKVWSEYSEFLFISPFYLFCSR